MEKECYLQDNSNEESVAGIWMKFCLLYMWTIVFITKDECDENYTGCAIMSVPFKQMAEVPNISCN